MWSRFRDSQCFAYASKQFTSVSSDSFPTPFGDYLVFPLIFPTFGYSIFIKIVALTGLVRLSSKKKSLLFLHHVLFKQFILMAKKIP